LVCFTKKNLAILVNTSEHKNQSFLIIRIEIGNFFWACWSRKQRKTLRQIFNYASDTFLENSQGDQTSSRKIAQIVTQAIFAKLNIETDLWIKVAQNSVLLP
jgi:hypothetical protein